MYCLKVRCSRDMCMNHFYLCSQRQITCSDDYASSLQGVVTIPLISAVYFYHLRRPQNLNEPAERRKHKSFLLTNKSVNEQNCAPSFQTVAATPLEYLSGYNLHLHVDTAAAFFYT